MTIIGLFRFVSFFEVMWHILMSDLACFGPLGLISPPVDAQTINARDSNSEDECEDCVSLDRYGQ